MTYVGAIEKKCFICGEMCKVYAIASTNRMGSPDLDTRPPEMERSTIKYHIQYCPSCHYCAPDITSGPDIAAQIIKSDCNYSAILGLYYPSGKKVGQFSIEQQFQCAA